MKLKLTVFGPNLRDQSKGQFVVHAAGCKDCVKLRHEAFLTEEFESEVAVAEYFYGKDEDGETTGLDEIYFAPCVNFPEKHAAKRRIRQNIWGNWKGYVGTRRIYDFGTDELEAKRWLTTGDTDFK